MTPRVLGGGRAIAAEGLLSGLVLQALLIISGILAARLLGPSDRGLLALIWVVTLVLTQLGCLGLPIAVTYELAQGGVTATTLIGMLRRTVLMQVIALETILAISLLAVASMSGLPSGPAIVALAVLPAMVVQSYCLAALQGSGAFRSLHVLRLLPSAAYALALVVGALAREDGLLFVTTSWVCSVGGGSVLTAAALYRLAKRETRCSDGRQTSRRAMIHFGGKGLLGYVSPTETFRIDQLLVGFVLSVHDLGLYVAALAFCNLPRFLAQGLGLVAYPAIARAPDQATKRRLLWKFVGLATAAAAVVVAPLVVFAHDLLDLAFGPEFGPASTTAQILLAGTVLLCARRLMADGLRGAGAPGAGSLAEALSWLWVIPALAVLVPAYGLMGVALALSTSYVVTAAVLISIAARRGLGLRPASSAPCSDPPLQAS